ncbi:MAG: phosphatidylserine decarboxylase [Thermoplasmatota archaeon]
MFARGGFKPIILASIPLIIALLFILLFSLELYHISLILLLLPIFSLYFFRDPNRKIEEGIVSPADGKVVYVDKEEKKLAIFMNILDVHVNRSPVDGKVIENKHYYGAHHPAYSEKSSNNEKNHIVLSTDHGKIDLLQITGIFARRIVPYIKKNDKIKKGDKIGLIRFGSRVELILPQDAVININEGEKVKAGEKIGDWYG